MRTRFRDRRHTLRLARALAVLLGLGAMVGCGDDGSGERGGANSSGKVSIALDDAPSKLTTSGSTVSVRGRVTSGSTVTLDAGYARVSGDRFVATITGLNLGRSSIVIRGAKPGLEPASVTVRVRRTRSARRTDRSPRKVRRPSPPAGVEQGGPETAQPEQNGGRLPPPPPRVRPFGPETRAVINRYLSRYYRDSSWFRSLEELRIERRGIFLDTRLREGNPASELAANDACIALKRFRLPRPIRVEGKGGAVIAFC